MNESLLTLGSIPLSIRSPRYSFQRRVSFLFSSSSSSSSSPLQVLSIYTSLSFFSQRHSCKNLESYSVKFIISSTSYIDLREHCYEENPIPRWDLSPLAL
ncbi:hypothetical protein L6452_11518 [Arctium lappa]|uniref:Uncharacterized protein n=1 Tax=Arctium lappa TaxID=4217 RepID=A0ACB9DP24_ARCLA|nr:hypothetical protein L6452_11518 [Arctium lappa]